MEIGQEEKAKTTFRQSNSPYLFDAKEPTGNNEQLQQVAEEVHDVTGLELKEECQDMENEQSIRDKLNDKEKQLDGSKAEKEVEKTNDNDANNEVGEEDQTGVFMKGETEDIDTLKQISMKKPKPAEEGVYKEKCVSLAFEEVPKAAQGGDGRGLEQPETVTEGKKRGNEGECKMTTPMWLIGRESTEVQSQELPVPTGSSYRNVNMQCEGEVITMNKGLEIMMDNDVPVSVPPKKVAHLKQVPPTVMQEEEVKPPMRCPIDQIETKVYSPDATNWEISLYVKVPTHVTNKYYNIQG